MNESRANVVSSFMVIKGSMIEETYTVFRDWDFNLSRQDNLHKVRDGNTIGAPSANWLRDVYKVLRRRFDPNGKDKALVKLAKSNTSMDIWKPLLLWHMTRDEFLVRDFLSNWLFSEYKDGAFQIRAEDLYSYLKELHTNGLIENPWKDTTLKRVASGLLRIAADFGLMTGTTVREFTSYNMPEESFIYLLHAMYDLYGNGHDVIHSPDWRLYMMNTSEVEREIYRLHQFRQLRFEVAGSLIELSLPCESAVAFAKEKIAL